MADQCAGTSENKGQNDHLNDGIPKPKAVKRQNECLDVPSCYGREFHGFIQPSEAEELLRNAGSGSYLIRCDSGQNILSYNLYDQIYFYPTSFDGFYWLMTRHFDNVEMMVKYGFADSFLAEYANHPEEEEEVVQIARCRQNSITVAEEVQQVFQVGPKAHNFVDGIFKIPKKCPFCRQYIWIVHERSKCADCGLPCHRRCQHQFQHDCLPSPKYVKGIFGIDLIRLCMAHAVHIPLVVEKCINEIEARGLEVEGIYRLSCSKSELDELMNKFDAGMVVDLSTIVDINCVAGLLKAFLKKLPSPILPNDIFANMFEYFMDPSNSEAEKQKFCREELSNLQPYHAMTLSRLFEHFRKVVEFSSQNFMDYENLARVFCPTLSHVVSKTMDPYISLTKYLLSTENLLSPPLH